METTAGYGLCVLPNLLPSGCWRWLAGARWSLRRRCTKNRLVFACFCFYFKIRTNCWNLSWTLDELQILVLDFSFFVQRSASWEMTDWETEPQTLNIIYSWPLTFPSAPAPVSPAQLSAGSVPPSAWWEGPGPERMPPWGDPDEAPSPPPPLPPPSPQTSLSLPPSSLNEPKQDQQKVNNNMCKHRKQQTVLFSFKNSEDQGGNSNLQNVWDDLSTTLINMLQFFLLLDL